MREVQLNSVYRHYKSKYYYTLALATHTETHEDLVIYHALYDEGEIFARPVEMFLSKVKEGIKNPTGQEYRFELVDFEI